MIYDTPPSHPHPHLHGPVSNSVLMSSVALVGIDRLDTPPVLYRHF